MDDILFYDELQNKINNALKFKYIEDSNWRENNIRLELLQNLDIIKLRNNEMYLTLFEDKKYITCLNLKTFELKTIRLNDNYDVNLLSLTDNILDVICVYRTFIDTYRDIKIKPDIGLIDFIKTFKSLNYIEYEKFRITKNRLN